MTSHDDIETSEADLRQVRARARLLMRLMSFGGLLLVALGTIPSSFLGAQLASGSARWPMTALVATCLGMPCLILASRDKAVLEQLAASYRAQEKVLVDRRDQREMDDLGARRSRLARAEDTDSGDTP